MSSYSQAIGVQESAFRSGVRVSPLVSVWLPSLGAVIFAVTLVHVLFLSEGTRSLFRDSDTGWHIRSGEAILSAAAVPRFDPYSYTRSGQPWFTWEWLSDVLLGSAHRVAGPSGVALLAALVIALTVWGAARFALSLDGNLFFTAIATVLLLGTTSIHWLARPHVFSWLAALVFLAIVERERRSSSESISNFGGAGSSRATTRTFYWLPALACLWANLHGSFLLGPAILFLYAMGEAIGAVAGVGQFHGNVNSYANARSLTVAARMIVVAWRAGRKFALAGAASLAATFVNPYGWHLHAHVLAYLRNTYLMDHISEFRSFSFHSPGAFYVELFLLVAVLGAVALVRQRAYGPALLALAMLHLSLYSARHLPTSAVLLLPLSVAALTREVEQWPRWRPFLEYSRRFRSIDRKVGGAVPVVLVLAATVAVLVPMARADRVGFDPVKFPAAAADFLEQRGLENRIFAKDQWGGYLIYRFQGRLKVFLDGRSDFYGQDMLETYARVMEVKPGWDTVLKQFDVRMVLVPPDHALASILTLSPDWKRVYSDPVATIFERIG